MGRDLKKQETAKINDARDDFWWPSLACGYCRTFILVCQGRVSGVAEVGLGDTPIAAHLTTQLFNVRCMITSIQKFLVPKKLNTTMIYARAYDQTVADDYFAAMQRIEQRLEIVPELKNETNHEVVKVLERNQMLGWVEQLAQPKLCFNERLGIVTQLQSLLSLAKECSPP